MKINFAANMIIYLTSAVFGAALGIGTIITTTPIVESSAKIPLAKLNSNSISDAAIVSSNPFGPIKTIPEKPTMPSIPVPQVPSMPGQNGVANNVLECLGVLPPDICILRKNGETLTAKLNSDTKFGYVSNISSSGVTVDGKFINLNR